MSSRYLVDTNILLRRLEPASQHHGAAVSAIRSLLTAGEILSVAPQGVYEFWNTATRPVASNGLGLTTAQAAHDMAAIEAAFAVLEDGPSVYQEWKRLVVTYQVEGRQVHDTRLVATMIVHGLTHLLTFNGKDFKRFEAGEGIVVVDPATVTPST